jgi:hypothetical protein
MPNSEGRTDGAALLPALCSHYYPDMARYSLEARRIKEKAEQDWR